MASYLPKQEPSIKPDPDAIGIISSMLDHDDLYEDTHDLEFTPDGPLQRLYLARIPRDLWAQWDKLDDDEEIHLGTIRKTTNAATGKETLQMLLRADLPAHHDVPKEHTLDIEDAHVRNTYVFTEADLPGYKRNTHKLDPAFMNMPARLTQKRFADRPQAAREPYNPNIKKTPFVRRGVPKKTVLKGKVAQELNCRPVDNAESKYIIANKTIRGMRPKAATVFLGDADTSQMINPGTIQAQGAFTGFIRNAGRDIRKKAQESKTARMPRNELLDALFGCFKRYKYWSMKALRAELRQPEAYLREVLEEVADLPKSGRFASNWTLKPGFASDHGVQTGLEEAAPGVERAGGTMEEEGDEDESMADASDDDEDFEDVDMLGSIPKPTNTTGT